MYSYIAGLYIVAMILTLSFRVWSLRNILIQEVAIKEQDIY